ncbi:hypothetical protein AAMO2058_000145400 [Amorphochlora amoebiformis]
MATEIPRIQPLTQEEVESVERMLKSANELAETLKEVAFTNKWCKGKQKYSGVWNARGTGYPIVGRFFIKQIGVDRLEGFVERESRAKVFGKCEKNMFDMTVQWNNGDMTHVGLKYNAETKESKQLSGLMNATGRSMRFPFLHYTLIPGTNEYADSTNTGSLDKKGIDSKSKDLYDKLLNNLSVVSKLYENISFERMAELFGMDTKGAQSLAECLLKCGQVTGSIDQEDQLVIFETPREATKKFNTQVREVCSLIQQTHDSVVKLDPSRAQKLVLADLESVPLSKWKTPKLRQQLMKRGLNSKGERNALIDRLKESQKGSKKRKNGHSSSKMERD